METEHISQYKNMRHSVHFLKIVSILYSANFYKSQVQSFSTAKLNFEPFYLKINFWENLSDL
jgi:hypothetical protein